MFAMMVDHYIGKNKVSSEGGLIGDWVFSLTLSTLITLFVIDSGHRVSWKKIEVSNEFLPFVSDV